MRLSHSTLFWIVFVCISGTATFAYAGLNLSGLIPWNFRIGDRVIDCTVYNILGTFYTVRVVQCVQAFIRDLSLYFLEYTSDFFLPITGALITLVIILFGIKLLTKTRQAEELKTEALMLLLKIGMVLMFILTFEDWAEVLFNALEDGVSLVTSAMWVTGSSASGVGQALADFFGGTSTACTLISALGPVVAPNLAAWAKIDCMVGQIVGFGPQIAMSGALLGMVSSMLFSGSMGIMSFLLGIFVLISLIMFVMRIVYIYLLAYMTLGLMIIFAPMFLPLVLLPQKAREMIGDPFTQWLGYIINSLILPMVLFAFLAIAYPVLQKYMFDETYPSSLSSTLHGLYRVDGTPRPEGRQEPETYYELSSRCFKRDSLTDPSFYRNLPDYLDQMSEGDLMVPFKSGKNDLAAFLPGCNSLDLGPEHSQRLWEIGFSLLQVAFVCYLMMTMMKLMPGLAGQLSNTGGALTHAVGETLGSNPASLGSATRQSQNFITNTTGVNLSSMIGKRT